MHGNEDIVLYDGGTPWHRLAAFVGGVVWVVIILALLSCARTFVPSGVPGCPNRTVWSDSAQRCVAKPQPTPNSSQIGNSPRDMAKSLLTLTNARMSADGDT